MKSHLQRNPLWSLQLPPRPTVQPIVVMTPRWGQKFLERFRVTFTANGKRELYHASKFSLNFCSIVHYFYPTISSFKLVCLQQLFWTAFSVAVRLKNSPYFCVFKYAQAFASSQTKGLERGWKQRARLRACEARALPARTTLTARFTDFFTDFEKKIKLTVLQSSCSWLYLLPGSPVWEVGVSNF